MFGLAHICQLTANTRSDTQNKWQTFCSRVNYNDAQYS